MSDKTFNDFIKLNRDMLECYATIHPQHYKMMNPQQQKDFCFTERVRVEDYLVRERITLKDFFAASKAT